MSKATSVITVLQPYLSGDRCSESIDRFLRDVSQLEFQTRCLQRTFYLKVYEKMRGGIGRELVNSIRMLSYQVRGFV